MKEKDIIEDVDSDELSSSDIQHYLPSKDLESLVPDENVYSLLEYISLDWPSQSVASKGDFIYAATNPEKENPTLVQFDFSGTDNYNNIQDFKVEKKEVERCYNRIRISQDLLFGISDNSFDVYTLNGLDKKSGITGEYGYGVDIRDKIAIGHRNGKISIVDYELNLISEFKYHRDTVESIVLNDNIIYSGSCDNTAKGFDMRSSQVIFEYKNSCDVNAVDFIDGKLIIGSDDGHVIHADLRNGAIEKIKWHATPISFVKWQNSTEFVSCSNEQIAFWDTTFEEEWEYHKYLRFVHQGQKFYKEVCFVDDMCVATSVDGLCFFKLAI